MTSPALETVPCAVCGSSQGRQARVRSPRDEWARRLELPGGRSRWVVCEHCGLVYQTPRPNPASVIDLYRGGSYHETRGGVPDHYVRYSLRRGVPSIEWAIALLGLPPEGDALDIGCGVGGSLVALRERGYTVTGVEPDPVLADVGRQRFGLDIVTGFLDAETLPARQFDLAYSCHVWEHLSDPLSTSRVTQSLLAPRRGHLVIVVPTFRRARTLAWACFSSPHTYMFTHVSLTNLLNMAGFEYVAHRYAGGADTELWLIARALPGGPAGARPVVSESVSSIQVELTLIPLRAPMGIPRRLATHIGTLSRDPADFVARLRQWMRTRWRRVRDAVRP